ncbi:dihydrofolate reductase [Candidatus Uhrbacteria bacterium]|jgi:dihydrofolate reductase|nr:dihydrofolate reductase [Candidatus Uhrbacteria bacterium]
MKVVGIAAISINGMIAQRPSQRSLDWASKDDLKVFKRVTKNAGVVIVGRKTYETIGKPLAERLMIVMTKEPSKYEGITGAIEFTDQSPQLILEDLKGRGFEEVAVIGGGEIYSLFLKEGLLTDLYVTVEPILFGNGKNLATDFDRIDTKLESVEKIGDQSVLLYYSLS